MVIEPGAQVHILNFFGIQPLQVLVAELIGYFATHNRTGYETGYCK